MIDQTYTRFTPFNFRHTYWPTEAPFEFDAPETSKQLEVVTNCKPAYPNESAYFLKTAIR